MGKRNDYTKYSENETNEVNEVVEEVAVTEVNEQNVVEEAEVNDAASATITGVVNNCTRLNLRKQPSTTSKVINILDSGDKVEIDDANSTEDFYKVLTESGIEGYCMKEYITVS